MLIMSDPFPSPSTRSDLQDRVFRGCRKFEVGGLYLFPSHTCTVPVELSLGCSICGDTGLQLPSLEELEMPKGKKILCFLTFLKKASDELEME